MGVAPPLTPRLTARDPMPKLKDSTPRLDQVITFRVYAQTRADWKAHARAAGLPLGDWIRQQVLADSDRRTLPKRKPPPAADPALLAAIARFGNNLNQIARAVNRQDWPEEIDLLRQLINIERAMLDLVPFDDD